MNKYDRTSSYVFGVLAFLRLSSKPIKTSKNEDRNKTQKCVFFLVSIMSWVPLSVELGDGKEGDETINHYDNAKLSKKALRDLPVNPGEEVGIVYGLEVCHDYELLGRSNNQTPKKRDQDSETEKSQKRKRKNESLNSQQSEDEVKITKKKEKVEKTKKKADEKNKSKKRKKKESNSTSERLQEKEQGRAVNLRRHCR